MRGLHVYVLLAVAALALAFADRLNAYWMHVAIIAMYYGILAASWSLLAGYVGLFSLGHTAFASIGGYTSALLVKWFGIPIPLGMVAGVVDVLRARRGHRLGVPAHERPLSRDLHARVLGDRPHHDLDRGRRDRGHGGAAHRAALPRAPRGCPISTPPFALLAVSLLLMGLLVRSRWGLFLRAIREDEQAAAASGVAVARFRILAFAIASGFAGLAGGFYAHYIGIMTPSVGDLDEMAKLVVMTVIGGMERLPTAVGGAFVVEFLLEVLRELRPVAAAALRHRPAAHHALRPQRPAHARSGCSSCGWGRRAPARARRRPRRAAEGSRRVSEGAELVRGVGLVKRFGGIVANDAVDFAVARGRPRRAHRPERLRQDHADQRADRPPRARTAARCWCAAGEDERPSAARLRRAWAWRGRSS